MVKITYDLNNKNDVEMVENYCWLKYQFKVINFDILNNIAITKYFCFGDNLENQEIIKHMVLSFSNENDLTKMAEILNNNYKTSYHYVEWLNIFYTSCETKNILRAYRWVLIERFGIIKNTL